jgi:hypothetical protein
LFIAPFVQAAIMRIESIPEAIKYVELYHELEVQIGGPESVDAKKAAELMAKTRAVGARPTGGSWGDLLKSI